MGQFHSSQTSSGSSEQSNQKTDYYELLGVTRGATDEE
jgi:DnaJ family protein A protein 5